MRKFILSLSLILTSCSSWQGQSAEKLSVCNQLKHQMIFNGATSNEQTAVQQRAEMDKLNQSYRDTGCA